MNSEYPLILSREVASAMSDNAPVVALESTIIAHGMPYPQNVETAMEVERIVREAGATPATIAILDGRLHAGLESHQLDFLGKNNKVAKASLRDMPFIVASGENGATTVAATMRIASMAGIRIFVTGGIGGVHRGANVSMDVSADLTEMSVTDVAVVSAGVKSILDIGLTLEKLETLGIPVVTFGCDEFPSFYSRESGHRSPFRVDDIGLLAAMLDKKWKMRLQGSVLIANPVPHEFEVPFAVMEQHILKALDAAEENGIRGKEVTPFLLKYLAGRTAGESLVANIELVKNNARLGARLAVAFQKTWNK
ncbi:MAG: pseudouridine-5'-phosphate glycosidase [Bacteroidota bacterium]